MEVIVQEKVKKILRGELQYTSSNLAFNMIISKMQKRVKADPGSMESCMTEMNEFL